MEPSQELNNCKLMLPFEWEEISFKVACRTQPGPVPLAPPNILIRPLQDGPSPKPATAPAPVSKSQAPAP